MEIKRILKAPYQGFFFSYSIVKAFILFRKFLEKELDTSFIKRNTYVDPDKIICSIGYDSHYVFKPIKINLEVNKYKRFYLLVIDYDDQEYYPLLTESLYTFFELYTPEDIIEEIHSKEFDTVLSAKLIYGTHTDQYVYKEVLAILKKHLLHSSDDNLKKSILYDLNFSSYMFELKPVFETIRKSNLVEDIDFALDLLDTALDDEDDEFIEIGGQNIKTITGEYVSNSQMISFDASSNSLTYIPSDFFKNTSLEYLWLCNNALSSIPDEIQLLKNLGELRLNGNKLEQLPSLMANEKLHTLDVSCNSIQKLRKLPKRIQNISASQNMLKDCDFLRGEFPSLQYVSLAGNRISHINDVFENISWLHYLDVSNNPLQQIPQSIEALSWLEILLLSDCPIKSFPSTIDKCWNIKQVDISRTLFRSIPASLFKLKRIEKLRFAGCKAKELPADISELKKLEYLDLSNNAIEKIPKEFYTLKHLKKFIFSGNSIGIKEKGELTEWAKNKGCSLFM